VRAPYRSTDRAVTFLYGDDVYWTLTSTYMTMRTSATYMSLTGHQSSKLLSSANRKSYMSCRLLQQRMTFQCPWMVHTSRAISAVAELDQNFKLIINTTRRRWRWCDLLVHLGREWSIAISLSVCVSVCLRAYLWNHRTDIHEILCAVPCGCGSMADL